MIHQHQTAMKTSNIGISINPHINDKWYLMEYLDIINSKGLTIPAGLIYKVGDIITIILDFNKKTLCFGINNKSFAYAKGATLDGSFNLFITRYYVNASFSILGNKSSIMNTKG
eukprot:506056_1